MSIIVNENTGGIEFGDEYKVLSKRQIRSLKRIFKFKIDARTKFDIADIILSKKLQFIILDYLEVSKELFPTEFHLKITKQVVDVINYYIDPSTGFGAMRKSKFKKFKKYMEYEFKKQ